MIGLLTGTLINQQTCFICESKLLLVSQGFFMSHIYQSRAEQLSVLDTETDVPHIFGPSMPLDLWLTIHQVIGCNLKRLLVEGFPDSLFLFVRPRRSSWLRATTNHI